MHKSKAVTKHKDKAIENESDYEKPNICSEAIQKKIISRFGNEFVKLAVDQLRDEFKEIAIDAVRKGAQFAINGDEVLQLEIKVEKAEKELQKLKEDKKELQKLLRTEIQLNKDVTEKLLKIEEQIKNQESMIREMKRELFCLREEGKARNKTETELRAEIVHLKQQLNKLKGKLLAKESASNIAKEEIPKLRIRIAALENELTQVCSKKR